MPHRARRSGELEAAHMCARRWGVVRPGIIYSLCKMHGSTPRVGSGQPSEEGEPAAFAAEDGRPVEPGAVLEPQVEQERVIRRREAVPLVRRVVDRRLVVPAHTVRPRARLVTARIPEQHVDLGGLVAVRGVVRRGRRQVDAEAEVALAFGEDGVCEARREDGVGRVVGAPAQPFEEPFRREQRAEAVSSSALTWRRLLTTVFVDEQRAARAREVGAAHHRDRRPEDAAFLLVVLVVV
mmetsp:Transcript_24402/g.96816  ORF Transcript_24402/g.96816 Transcript_24402/m.96816 type:complete len:238 (-) Transcript_24402:165-878(-)